MQTTKPVEISKAHKIYPMVVYRAPSVRCMKHHLKGVSFRKCTWGDDEKNPGHVLFFIR